MIRNFQIAIFLLPFLAATGPAAAQFSPIPTLPQPVVVVPPAAAMPKTCCHDECASDASCRRGAVCPAICTQKCAPCP